MGNCFSQFKEKSSGSSKYNQKMITLYQDQIIDGYLEIQNNLELKSLDFIDNLKDLKDLEIHQCPNVIRCPKIQSKSITRVSFSFCKINNFRNIELENLEQISFCGNKKSNFRELIKFKTLKDLQIGFINVNINSISSMTYLKQLKLIQCQISNISVLSQFLMLEQLDLTFNPKIIVSQLSNLVQLTKLSLAYCQIQEISAFSTLINLKDLSLYKNNITNLTPLSKLIGLQKLYLGGNQVSDILVLRSLRNLQCLDISNNKITYISPLKELINLINLNISHNTITNIEPVKSHPHFNNYKINNQGIPTRQDILLSNIIKSFEMQISQSKHMKYGILSIRKGFDQQKRQINVLISAQCIQHEQFTTIVASLFESSNSVENCQ
ncbi:leucine-rich_repeat domain-containing protein [Hexamita inflata]|uniref:Leucine-rich repeat domain-containing protein n=1 Tax=Hexamita inflata TaxID=28002 RepID=A0AA86R7P4_9EUKA|nr:leucine-rich repeat domain-containing protein [Hexamita inflata]